MKPSATYLCERSNPLRATEETRLLWCQLPKSDKSHPRSFSGAHLSVEQHWNRTRIHALQFQVHGVERQVKVSLLCSHPRLQHSLSATRYWAERSRTQIRRLLVGLQLSDYHWRTRGICSSSNDLGSGLCMGTVALSLPSVITCLVYLGWVVQPQPEWYWIWELAPYQDLWRAFWIWILTSSNLQSFEHIFMSPCFFG